ncbi:hypothetical protein BDV97DRAFT_297171 [Delphinella strobiligena]|nr:hypothetical protein BDV97DRAFT_297171 [Delphinella strobiligena]
MTNLSTLRVHLTSKHEGYARIDKSPPGCIELLNELLQKNHDQFDMFWREVAGHNHTVHSMLSVYALGGSPEDLQRAYDDDDPHQAPLSAIDNSVIESLSDPDVFLATMYQLDQYGNYLRFFEQQIKAKGWKAVMIEYVFSRTQAGEAMFAQLFEGAYHPLIHVGFGIEFEQPSIVAEGLAHCATHDSANIKKFFAKAEQLASSESVSPKPLVELYKQVRDTEKIKSAAKMMQGPVRVRDGVVAGALDEIAAVAAQFQVPSDGLRRGIVEMMSCAAFSCGGAQRPGKSPKIDFFYMHDVTSSIFLIILERQDWISIEDKVRLVEWKGRMDLVWYAASSAPVLDTKWIESYQPTLSKGMYWRDLYKAVNVDHDDGHLAKIVRALKNAEDVEKLCVGSKHLPVKGDMWFKIAQMAYDSTVNLPIDAKWIMGAGFDPLWNSVPDLKTA